MDVSFETVITDDDFSNDLVTKIRESGTINDTYTIVIKLQDDLLANNVIKVSRAKIASIEESEEEVGSYAIALVGEELDNIR